jgi:hypothetical protein
VGVGWVEVEVVLDAIRLWSLGLAGGAFGRGSCNIFSIAEADGGGLSIVLSAEITLRVLD